MTTHGEVFTYRVLFVARHVVENEDRIGPSVSRWDDLSIVRVGKVFDSIDERQYLLEISILWLMQRFRVHVHVLKTQTVRTL